MNHCIHYRSYYCHKWKDKACYEADEVQILILLVEREGACVEREPYPPEESSSMTQSPH